eukprot:1160695-Pelagomonas_calceolata.AAC.9
MLGSTGCYSPVFYKRSQRGSDAVQQSETQVWSAGPQHGAAGLSSPCSPALRSLHGCCVGLFLFFVKDAVQHAVVMEAAHIRQQAEEHTHIMRQGDLVEHTWQRAEGMEAPGVCQRAEAHGVPYDKALKKRCRSVL